LPYVIRGAFGKDRRMNKRSDEWRCYSFLISNRELECSTIKGTVPPVNKKTARAERKVGDGGAGRMLRRAIYA